MDKYRAAEERIAEHALEAKRIQTAINRAKRELVEAADSYGIWECFGQYVVSKIEEAYCTDYSHTGKINQGELQRFDEWCKTVSLDQEAPDDN